MRYVLCLLAALTLLQAAPADAQTRQAAQAHLRRGDVLLSRNQVEAALKSYDQAVAAAPEWAAAYLKRGAARRAKGDLDGSIADYEKAGELEPRSTANSLTVAESYNHRGMNRLDRLEVEGAVADFTKAIEHNAKEPNFFFRRGKAYLIDEALAKAVADFDRATAINRGSNNFLTTMLYVHRGYALLLQGKEDEARKEFAKCEGRQGATQAELQLYLLGIEVQIRERRRRRAEELKRVASLSPNAIRPTRSSPRTSAGCPTSHTA